MPRPEPIFLVRPHGGAWHVECQGVAYTPVERASRQEALATAILVAQQHEPSRVDLLGASGEVEWSRRYARPSPLAERSAAGGVA
ncbi:MAG: hypothetical protein IT376_12210 [Polyangiaceae bacterium]|nr:hypothetical protein [Polyangiaceae bacterium]